MTIIERKDFIQDPVYKELLRVILANHKVEEQTRELFIKDRTVGLHEIRATFAIMGPFQLKYKYESRLKDPGSKYTHIGIKVTEITIFDNFQEYEAYRIRTLSSTKNSTGLNLS